MRTGLWPEPEPESVERKFNPWHDPEDGRFTFAGQGRYFGRGGSRDNASPLAARPKTTRPARAAKPAPSAARAQSERVAREVRERDAFKKLMLSQEGGRNDVYIDTTGNATVGIGHKVTTADGLRRGARITDAQKEAFWRADADRALRAARSQMRLVGITDDSFLLPLA